MFIDADKFIKYTLGIGILLAGLSIAYHYTIYLPKVHYEEIERIEKEKKQKKAEADALMSSRKFKYQICMDAAYSNYNENWLSECKRQGIAIKSDNCALPMTNANSQNEKYENNKKKCLEEFKLGI